MHPFIDSLLTRAQASMKESGSVSALLDRPWVGVGVGGPSKFVFRSGGELLVSQRGDIETARWEHIPALHALLLDFDGERTLFSFGFCGEAVLVLRRDGTDDNMLLGDEALIGPVSEDALVRYLDRNRPQLSESQEVAALSESPVPPLPRVSTRRRQGWLSLASGVLIGIGCLLLFILFSDGDGATICPYPVSDLFSGGNAETVRPPDASILPVDIPVDHGGANPFLDPSFKGDALPTSYYSPTPASP